MPFLRLRAADGKAQHALPAQLRVHKERLAAVIDMRQQRGGILIARTLRMPTPPSAVRRGPQHWRMHDGVHLTLGRKQTRPNSGGVTISKRSSARTSSATRSPSAR